ncbi:hypothetical protein GGD83_003937 [Rhodoblastus sphagnicola]|nr:hypothetical protein [Rhodoblastus sphagnicola]
MASRSVVLPTPGPPVTSATFDFSAMATASSCDAASVFPVFLSAHATATGASISGHGVAPTRKESNRSATPSSAKCKPRRKMQSAPSMASAPTSPANSSSPSAVSICPAGMSRMSVASCKAKKTPARNRCGDSLVRPNRMAMALDQFHQAEAFLRRVMADCDAPSGEVKGATEAA